MSASATALAAATVARCWRALATGSLRGIAQAMMSGAGGGIGAGTQLVGARKGLVRAAAMLAAAMRRGPATRTQHRNGASDRLRPTP